MKTVFCFVFGEKPKIDFYSFCNNINNVIKVKFSYFAVDNMTSETDKKKSSKTGRLGKKGNEYLASVKLFESANFISFNWMYNLVEGTKNHLFGENDFIMFDISNGKIHVGLCFDTATINEKFKEVIAVLNEYVINFAYGFQIEREKLPYIFLSGGGIINSDLKSTNSQSEQKLNNAIHQNLIGSAPYRLPYITPLMYMKPNKKDKCVALCERMKYEATDFFDGLIIDTSMGGGYGVMLMNRNNELFRFFEEENFAFLGDEDDLSFF